MTDACPPVAFSLLGGVRVELDGAEVRALGGPQPRAVLAALLAADGRTVTTGALVEAVWGEDPPASAVSTLHSYVSRLRTALGPAGALLRRRGEGYLLDAPADSVDWRRFEHLVEQGRAALEAGDPTTARARLVEAEGLWRGPALGDLADRPFAAGLVARWDGLRAAAVADRQEADLRLGRHAALLGELAEAVRAAPLDEARWCRLALAHYRCGRQADALAAVAEARRTLVDELGVEPGPALRELELQVLRQDPALDLVPTARPAAVPAQRPAGTARTRDALVGRTHELAVLEAVLAESAEGARAGVVEGEAGIGKTRLLEELAARASAQGALVLWGRSHESGAAPAFWPWLPVLRALRDRAPDDAEPGLTALLEARARRPRDRAVLGAGRRRGRAAPHGPGRARRGAARRPAVGRCRLAVAADVPRRAPRPRSPSCCSRPCGSGRASVRPSCSTPSPRSPGGGAAAGCCSAACVPRTPPGSSARRPRSTCHPTWRWRSTPARRATPSSPGSSRSCSGPGEVATAPVPAGVGDVVRQRLARLPAATTGLLQVAAVVGRDVDLRLLAEVTDRPVAACLADLEPAVAQHLLTDDAETPGVLRFVHALVREVLADDLTPTRRASVHLQVADALAGRRRRAGRAAGRAPVVGVAARRRVPSGGGARGRRGGRPAALRPDLRRAPARTGRAAAPLRRDVARRTPTPSCSRSSG